MRHARPLRQGRPHARVRTVFGGVVTLAAMSALAQPDPSGIDFVTVGAPNNPAYHGPDPENRVTGRGSVPYEYRLSRTEITTGQWLEFFNAASARPDRIEFAFPPSLWGGTVDTTYTGPGTRYRLRSPSAENVAVYGISWRTAAVYSNWLTNGKSLDHAAFLSGAYDVSTFHTNSDNTFTDQATHTPGATYWIPTLDEWLKGAHYDPTHAANDGWWLSANQKDRAPIYGPPITFGGDGTGEANAGFHLSGSREFDIPLGSYPTQSSYFGLLDTAGEAGEWTEEIITSLFDGSYRVFEGSSTSTSVAGAAAGDLIHGYGGGNGPSVFDIHAGFRLATSIPAPSSFYVMAVATFALSRHRVRPRRWACAGRESRWSRRSCSAM